MDVKQYLAIFIDETSEHLQSLNNHLLVLEQEPDNQETINEIFRAAHSIKGMSATMGFNKMQTLTHDMENVFSEIRNGKMQATSDLVDVLFKGLDCLEAYLANIQEEQVEGDLDNQEVIDELDKIYKAAMSGGAVKKAAKKDEEKINLTDNKNESTEKDLFRNVEFEDHEILAVDKAEKMGLNVIGLTVYIQETCMLKAARAFMINRAMETVGEVIKLYPIAQDLEDENYDLSYSAYVVTKKKVEELIAIVMNVSEVAEVVGDYITLDKIESASKEQTLKKIKAKEITDAIKANDTKKTTEKHINKPSTVNRQVASRSIRVDIEKLDVLMNYVSELIIAKNSIKSATESNPNINNIDNYMEQIEYLERLTSNIHESVTRVRMVPIDSIVNRFPRMIRDLAKKLNKEMELYMSGEDTELDRTVIDEIGDPLMHLLRNSADHGLETVEQRKKSGKSEKGTIYLNAYQEGNNVVIEVGDDGAGINLEKIKNKAVEKGTITQEEANKMTDEEAMGILFKPSFSTSDNITDVSGRGVGLDVVRTKIESLGGALEASTVLGQGSKFVIRLPLTLAVIQTLMITLEEEKYAIPLASIQTVEDIAYDSIKLVEGINVINLRGQIVPIINLAETLDTVQNKEKEESALVVIIKKGDKQVGLIIDDLLGQEEIVIKPVGKHIKTHKIISGATILGNGDIALILDVNSLI